MEQFLRGLTYAPSIIIAAVASKKRKDGNYKDAYYFMGLAILYAVWAT